MPRIDKKRNRFSDFDSSVSSIKSVKSVDSRNRSFRHSTPKRHRSDPTPSTSREVMRSCENCKNLERKIDSQILAINEIKLNTRQIVSSVAKLVEDRIESKLRITTVKPADAKKVAENELSNKIMEKRANPKWRKNLEKLHIDGVVHEQLVKLQEIYRGRTTKPSKLSLDIARVLWKKDFISAHIIGPASSSNRSKDRKKVLPYHEEEKLKSALEVFSSTFMRDNEWHWFVRDPINQATRDPRTNWTREGDDSLDRYLENLDDIIEGEGSSKKAKNDKEKSAKEKEKEKSKDDKSKSEKSRKSKEGEKDETDTESTKSTHDNNKTKKDKKAKNSGNDKNIHDSAKTNKKSKGKDHDEDEEESGESDGDNSKQNKVKKGKDHDDDKINDDDDASNHPDQD